MLASETLARIASGLECSRVPSGGLLGQLERLVMGGDSGLLPAQLADWIVDQSPGRARALAREAAEEEPPWVILGESPRVPGELRGSLFRIGQGANALEGDALLHELDMRNKLGVRPTHLVLRSVVAEIDERGNRQNRNGVNRVRALGELDRVRSAAATHGASLGRFVVGELVDRWRWGSYSQREGILGVDRVRGTSGYRLLATDAADVDLSGVVRGLSASSTNG